MSTDKDRRSIRRACSRDYSRLILSVMDEGHRYRMTKAGIMFYGPNGETLTIHLTNSDPRSFKNTKALLAKLGLLPKERQ